MTADMDFESLLKESVKTHGHLCPGQVLGVKMALLGLRRTGIRDPRGRDRKNLIVFVEMDRCATDAIQSVTGCTLGKRTMKFMDYGKMAATFLNIKSGKAVRIIGREDVRKMAKACQEATEDRYAAQIRAYRAMGEEVLFEIMDVGVEMKPEDMPGRPLKRIPCELCGEYVQDMREVYVKRKALCRPCAQGGYYVRGRGFLFPTAMQKSHNGMEIKSKLWIEVKGEAVFGRGRRFLLQAIDTYGSINRAAKEVNISYRKAWGYVKAMEERLGMKLVERQAGGRNGGGATLTEDAKEFLEKYEKMEEGIREIVDAKFNKIFGIPR